jgi:hypothetical protein
MDGQSYFAFDIFVIPNLPEGGQERDLTSACTNGAVWLRRIQPRAPIARPDHVRGDSHAS